MPMWTFVLSMALPSTAISLVSDGAGYRLRYSLQGGLLAMSALRAIFHQATADLYSGKAVSES